MKNLFMMKILVLTDFSASARAATEVAIAIANKANAEIFFLHMCQDTSIESHVPYGVEHPANFVDQNAVHRRNELLGLVTRATASGVKASSIFVLDKGNEQFEDYVEPYHIDFIVMGSHGVKGMREFILGSSAQRMIRHASVPLMVIKEMPGSLDFRNIVFASAFQENVLESFKEVAAFAMMLNAKVQLVYINFVNHPVEPAVAEARMKNLASAYPNVTCYNHVAETNNEEWAIHQFATELKADLICVSKHDKDGFIRFLSPSVAEELVNHEQLPVLVLTAP